MDDLATALQIPRPTFGQSHHFFIDVVADQIVVSF